MSAGDAVKTTVPCTAARDMANYRYLLEYIGETAQQRALRVAGEGMDLPNMMASPDEYQFLAWLAASVNAKKLLEVGTFRGVTTLALALQLPDDARITALDVSEEWTAMGQKAWRDAGVAHKINLVIGPATASMQRMLDEGKEAGTYDFVFIDANKDDYGTYYEQALQLVRVGGIIAVDNTLFHGEVLADPAKTSPSVRAIQELNDRIRADKRVSAVMSIIADGVYFVRKIA